MSKADSVDDTADAQEHTDQAGGAGGTSPPTCFKDNDEYDNRRLNSTDSSSDHACSWREMYAKMGVEAPDE